LIEVQEVGAALEFDLIKSARAEEFPLMVGHGGQCVYRGSMFCPREEGCPWRGIACWEWDG